MLTFHLRHVIIFMKGLIIVNLGNRIKLRRESLNFSQEELAKMVGYKSRSSINKIELGINDISQSKILAFAKALQTTPGYLMGWEKSPDKFAEQMNKSKIDQDNIAMIGYNLLDDNDKGIIKGEIRQMLRADKYKGKTYININSDN